MKYLFFGFALLASSAIAAEAPHIDMMTVITDLHGKPIPDGSQATPADPQCQKCSPLTLGVVVATALLTDRKDEPNLSALDKAKRGLLAMRIVNDKAAALTAPQISEIERLLNVWPPLIVARALPLIDPATDLSGK